MDILKKNTWLWRMVIVLVLLNLGLLAYIGLGRELFRGERPEPELASLAEVLKNKLDLTAPQYDSLLKIRMDFFTKEVVLEKAIRTDRDSMNELMFSELDAGAHLIELSQHVAAKEGEMEQLRIAQAERIRGVLNPQQRLRLHQLLKEVRDFMKPDDPYKSH